MWIVLVNFNLIKEHSEADHGATAPVLCQQCGKKFTNKETHQSHMIENHKDAAIFHTMAKQVDDLTDKFEDLAEQNTSLKEEITSIK